MERRKESPKKPTIAFLLSFTGGLLILGGGLSMLALKELAFSSLIPLNLQGILEAGYTAMQNAGWGSGLTYALGVSSGVIGGIPVLIGAIMLYRHPSSAATWGYVIVAFSFVSLIGIGGFLVGAVLGEIGGARVILRKRSVPEVIPKSESLEAAQRLEERSKN